MPMRRNASLAALAVVCSTSLSLAACGGGGDTAPPPAPRLAGTVAGLAGQGLVLLAAGQRLDVPASGAFTFGTLVAAGQPFAVTVAQQPTCPGQTCTVTGGSGVMPATGDTAVTVSCAANARTRLVTANWNDTGDPTYTQSLRITDDFQALANGATAAPRVVRGAATTLQRVASLDGLAVDPVRGVLYVSDETTQAIHRFEGLGTLSGDVAPAWTRLFPTGDDHQIPGAMALDVARDRLYVAVSRLQGADFAYELQVFEPASGASPALVAQVVLSGATRPWGLDLDARNDRLWLARWESRTVERFDGASSLTPAAVAARTLTFGTLRPATLAIDACHDRLYVGSHLAGAGGVHLVGFDGAAALATGPLDEAADADVILGGTSEAIGVRLDDQDRLHVLTDSADRVRTYAGASALTGVVPVTAATEVLGAVAMGYGIDAQTMP